MTNRFCGNRSRVIVSHEARRCLAFAAALSVSLSASAATPAANSAFLALPKVYVIWEITETGLRHPNLASKEITDGAYRINRSLKGVVPLNMAMPGSYPPSSMPMSPMETMEEGRFIGWMAAPPDAPDASGTMDEMMTGQMDVSTNPMFLPAEFAIDDEEQFLYRDFPSQPFGTQTTTTKGHGKVYMALSGMMMCDLKKMTCDINNILFNFNEGKDAIIVTTSSDVPGFEGKTETGSPTNDLPKLPSSIAAKLTALPLRLPLPMTATFSAPWNDEAPQTTRTGDQPRVVTFKVTLSATAPPS